MTLKLEAAARLLEADLSPIDPRMKALNRALDLPMKDWVTEDQESGDGYKLSTKQAKNILDRMNEKHGDCKQVIKGENFERTWVVDGKKLKITNNRYGGLFTVNLE